MESLNQGAMDYASSSSDSPDSLYSNGSPTFPNQEFEYDVQEDREEQGIQHHDEEDYESLMESTQSWSSPAWGNWPETTSSGPGWTPLTKQAADTPSKRSIISISPRGSMASDRRGSTPASKIIWDGARRESDPSLLGFDLAQRRRSSTRSLNSARRRSSALSTGSSLMDSIEDVRVRNIASIDGLGRRFSEVVEVTCPSDSDDDDTAVARAAMSQWSPYTSTDEDDDDDESEINTAPYFPTPVLAPTIPALLSNYPLSSVAREHYLNTPSDLSASPSPVIPARIVEADHHRLISTPPPPMAPSALLRERSRPALARAATDYQFPPRTGGVPAGAAPPRPMLNRATSTPFFSAALRSQEAAREIAQRVTTSFPVPGRCTGSFPIARPTPLGISPLRISLRRESVISDSEAPHRGRVADPRDSQELLASRRTSGSMVADRRLSVIKGIPVPWRSSDTHSSSSANKIGSSRNSSIASVGLRRDSLASLTSSASTRSSIVSISEYGYLAPQIVVNAPPSAVPVAQGLGSRRNAPTLVVLPAASFNFPTSAPNTPFSPMESFLGRSSPFAPTPVSPGSDIDKTPMMPQFSPPLMEGSRTISPLQFRDSFNFFERVPASPKSGVIFEMPRQISRKAVPKMSFEELAEEVRRDGVLRTEREAEIERRFERRGATNLFSTDEQAILRAAAAHRRNLSVETQGSASRPPGRRQKTLPAELDQIRVSKRRSPVESVLATVSDEPHKPKDRVVKRASVTFADVTGRPKMERSVSTSSFTRFFHAKPKPITQPHSILSSSVNPTDPRSSPSR